MIENYPFQQSHDFVGKPYYGMDLDSSSSNAMPQNGLQPSGFNSPQENGLENRTPNGDDDDVVCVSPDIYYGTLKHLNNTTFGPHDFKIIINCLPTHRFLRYLQHNSQNLSISSDVIMLSLDLNFDINQYNDEEKHLLEEFLDNYNKVLQNFINYFVTYNENYSKLINELPNNLSLKLMSPLLLGNLKNNVFKLIRLIKLIKLMNNSVQVLVVGEYNENISKSLLIGNLMDTYNFPLSSSISYLQQKLPLTFNLNYYNDLLILENMKKFYQENNDLKANSTVLYENKGGKRGRDDDYDNFKRFKR